MKMTAADILNLPSNSKVTLDTVQLQTLINTVQTLHNHKKTLDFRLAMVTTANELQQEELNDAKATIRILNATTIGIKCISSLDLSDILKS